MTPIRAVIIGPLRLQCIRTSMAVAIPGADFFFGEPVDVVGGIPQRRRRPAVGEVIGSLNLLCQPLSAIRRGYLT
jgi:hypothetical protein